MKRVLRIAALPLAAALIALIAAMFLGPAGSGTAAPDSSLAGKWCAGKKIVFFPGGRRAVYLPSTSTTARNRLRPICGPKVQYVWSNWDPQTMVSQFKSAIATKPTGIAVMGHPGDAALKPWVTAAEAKGIIVTSQNAD